MPRVPSGEEEFGRIDYRRGVTARTAEAKSLYGHRSGYQSLDMESSALDDGDTYVLCLHGDCNS